MPSEAEILAFCQSIPIATKDEGFTTITPWGTQRYLLREILRGLEDGVRQFLIHKHRQGGISTWLLLLTIFWLRRYAGLQGLTVTDSDDNAHYFRDLFLDMLQTATDVTAGEEPVPGLRTRNRFVLSFHNHSRLLLQTAGPRTWKRLGVGRGLSYFHGTEVPLWGNGQAITYVRAAFSETHPAGLYLLEGTSRGKNFWFDLWEDAADAATMRQIFIGFWLHDHYTVSRTDLRWRKYWDGTLTPREREWDREVRERYGIAVAPERWAWRRWFVAEKAGGSERMADTEMPVLPEDAFGASQERPFLETVSRARVQDGVRGAPSPIRYNYTWGAMLEDTRPEPVAASDPAMLTVWTPPDDRPVVVGAVPAYSSFESDPHWVVSVWAASLEKEQLEQCAELCTDAPVGVQPFSWLLLHLAGAYGASYRTVILEVVGLGMAVLAEIKRLVATGWGTSRRAEFRDFLGSVRSYIWRRPDSQFAMGALQWRSSEEIQGGVLQRFRDQLARGYVIVRSQGLADELDRLEGSGDTFKPGGREPRAHRAMAGALAIESYASQLYPYLRRARSFAGPATNVPSRAVMRFMEQLQGRRAVP